MSATNQLEITDKDTVPIPSVFNNGSDITGWSFVLNVKNSTTQFHITGVIVDASKGCVNFNRTATTFPKGTYSAEVVITNAQGEETTELFYISVKERLI